MTRAACLAVAAALIATGLAWRLVPWGLPLWAHHFGGGLLWGAMLYMLAAAARPAAWGRAAALAVACTVAAGIELFRLCHTPALDIFRTTLAGQLLLGRLFSPWNILVDMSGAAIAAIVAGPLRSAGAQRAAWVETAD